MPIYRRQITLEGIDTEGIFNRYMTGMNRRSLRLAFRVEYIYMYDHLKGLRHI